MYFKSRGITPPIFVGKSSLMNDLANFGCARGRSTLGSLLIPPGNDWNHYNEYINPIRLMSLSIRNPMGVDRPHLEKIPSPSICLLTTPLKTNWYPKWRHVWSSLTYMVPKATIIFGICSSNFRGGCFFLAKLLVDLHRLRARSSVESSNWTDNPPRGREADFWTN